MAESYAHRFAKQALASWLRGRSRVGKNFKGLQPFLPYLPISTNKPMYGVYEEYPVCTTGTGVVIGLERTPHAAPGQGAHLEGEVLCKDATGWHCWESSYGKIASRGHRIPTAKDIKRWNEAHPLSSGMPQLRLNMNYFFDVGLVDPEGRLAVAFEVKHTHPTPQAKIDWMEANGVRWFELSADWILNRCQSPFNITGAILRPWTETVCYKCGEEDLRLMSEQKLGRNFCISCVEEKSLCRHVDCLDFRDPESENDEWCPIHARLID